MSLFADLMTVVVASSMMGNEFAIAAFVHPQLRKLPPQGHAEGAMRLASILGRVMPFWYALALLLLCVSAFRHRPISHGAGLALAGAAVLWAATIVFTVTILVPINNRIARLDPNTPYRGWLDDRARWDRLHWVRVGILGACVGLLVFGLLPNG